MQGFSIMRTFAGLDTYKNGCIDERGLRRFLKRVGHNPLKEELLAIMRRIDQDGDACISFYEFEEALTPVCVQLVEDLARPAPKEHFLSSSIKKFGGEYDAVPRGQSPLRTKSSPSTSPVATRSRVSYEEMP